MCLITYGKVRDVLNFDRITNAWESNPDGAGIIYKSGGKIYARKMFSKFSLLHKALKELHHNQNVAVHLRLATHGAINKENCHPFPIPNGFMMHNGILLGLGKAGKAGYSDSKHLSEILSQLKQSDRIALLSTLQGKFLTWDNNGVELFGHWETYGGLHVSNKNFIPYDREFYPAKANYLDFSARGREYWQD